MDKDKQKETKSTAPLMVNTSFKASKRRQEHEETIRRGGDKIVNCGKKNDFYAFLVDMYNGSAWHQGIIKGKTHYIAGGGIYAENGNLDEWIENSPSSLNMNDVAENLTLDQELFGKIHAKGYWNLEGTRVIFWEHIDSDMVRANAEETTFFISDDWLKPRPKYETVQGLDLTNRTGSFILSYKEPSKRGRKDLGVYGKPGYIGAINAIETDVEISLYHLREIQNSLKLGAIINLANGAPSEDKKEEVAKETKERFSDMEESGGFTITWSDGNDNKPSILQLTGNDLDKRYLMTEKSVQQNILVGHSANTPLLFGIKTEGQLGGSGELLTGYELFKNTYVNTKQKRLEAFLQVMVDLSGYVGTPKLNDAPPLFSVARQNNSKFNGLTEEEENENEIIKSFGKIGIEKSETKFYNRTPLTEENINDLDTFESGQLTSYFDTIATITASLEEQDKTVLSLVNEGNDIVNIASAMQLSVETVAISYNKLLVLGLIDTGEATDLGQDLLNNVSTSADDYEIVYSYEVREGYGSEIIPTTRNFCEKLIKLDRFYTRKDIDLISQAFDSNVWNYRGGWFNDNGKNTPFCRHEWVQNLILK